MEMHQIINGNIYRLCRCQEVKNVTLLMHDAGRRPGAIGHLKSIFNEKTTFTEKVVCINTFYKC